MKLKIFLPFLLIFAIISCEKNTDQLHSVSGYLYVNNKPIADVSVTIDDMLQYTTESNPQGYFQIENVPNGKHQLTAYKNSLDSTFVEKSYDVDVYADVSIDSIFLPNPVSIEYCSLDSTNNEVTLTWTKSEASDFREYKIYSHNTSGIDETTGTLEHVATDINEIAVTLNITSGTTLFYRVFVMNEFGRLGGSNIKSATGINYNLLLGGDFENEDLFFSSWQIWGNVYIIDSIQKNGKKCLLLNSNIDTVNFSITQCFMQSSQF